MVVGIDVHKRAHVAALLDERGGELATLDFANSPAGMRKLLDWLVAHDAGEAVVGVESPAGYGRSSSPRSRRQGTRCLTSRPGAPIRSAAATGPARRTRATRSPSPRWCYATRRARTRARARARPRPGAARAAAPPPRPRPHAGGPTAPRRLESGQVGVNATSEPPRPDSRDVVTVSRQMRHVRPSITGSGGVTARGPGSRIAFLSDAPFRPPRKPAASDMCDTLLLRACARSPEH
jgi:Transposase